MKTSNGESLESWIIVDTRSAIFGNTCGFIPPELATSMQLKNTRSSTYMNKYNNFTTKTNYKEPDTKQQNQSINTELLNRNLLCRQL